MTPAVGQAWCSAVSGVVYRVVSVDYELPGACVRVENMKTGAPRWLPLDWFGRAGTFVGEAA